MPIQKDKVILRIRSFYIVLQHRGTGFGSSFDENLDLCERVFLPLSKEKKIILSSNPLRWRKILPVLEAKYYIQERIIDPTKQNFLDSFFVLHKRHKDKLFRIIRNKEKIQIYLEEEGDIFFREAG